MRPTWRRCCATSLDTELRAVDTGGWLTAARVARLHTILRAIRSHPPPGVPLDRAERIVWSRCGGPLDDVGRLLRVLVATELVARGSVLRLSSRGRTIATQDHQSGGTLIARALIRAGHFADQARRLSESGALDAMSGDFVCPRSRAIESAAQLVGILRRFPGVRWDTHLRISTELLNDLIDFWSLVPQQSPIVDDGKKAIGDRGELYSYRLERLRCADAGHIRWVARDSGSLGYDIEDQSVTPHRRIEAKASALQATRFILSANEWDVAHRHGTHYEIHFWGGIDLGRQPADEYEILRARGYPRVYVDLPSLLAEAQLRAEPTHYLITTPTPKL